MEEKSKNIDIDKKIGKYQIYLSLNLETIGIVSNSFQCFSILFNTFLIVYDNFLCKKCRKMDKKV